MPEQTLDHLDLTIVKIQLMRKKKIEKRNMKVINVGITLYWLTATLTRINREH